MKISALIAAVVLFVVALVLAAMPGGCAAGSHGRMGDMRDSDRSKRDRQLAPPGAASLSPPPTWNVIGTQSDSLGLQLPGNWVGTVDGWNSFGVGGGQPVVGDASATFDPTRAQIPPDWIVNYPNGWPGISYAVKPQVSEARTGVPSQNTQAFIQLNSVRSQGIPSEPPATGQSPFAAGGDSPNATLEELRAMYFRGASPHHHDYQALLEAHQRAVAAAEAEAAAKPPEFVLRPGDELLVIERRKVNVPPPTDDLPGCGSLMTRVNRRAYVGPYFQDGPEVTCDVPVPLTHTDVDARIDGYVSGVRVTQRFENPFSETIEALYVFPLPEDAAVSDFVMTIGERRIRGVIREREQARQVYEEARRQGHTASLLTQERPNVFTQHVANIEPGKGIDVTMTYFNTLAYHDGWFEFVFPMVVGPRFNPPRDLRHKPFRDGVGSVERGADGASRQVTEVQYLRPAERSGHDIAVKVAIDAGVPIESLECRSHQVNVLASSQGGHRANVALSPLDSVPNKDFVLRWRVAGERLKTAMLTQVTEKGGFFTLMIVPPSDLKYVERAPTEMVFVIDCSGSMDGEPLAQARRAVVHAIRSLRPEDSFQVVNFGETASLLGDRGLPATWDNVKRGIDYVESLRAGGGTYMVNGLRAALGFPHDPRRTRFVCFLTDGFIGNEAEVLGELKKHLGESRVFSMGMGSAPNRHLLEEMARLGRGAAAHVGLQDDAASVMGMFMDRATHAALTDVRIDWGGLEVDEVFPARTPDVFVGRPVMVTGRFRGAGATTVTVSGRAGAGGERVPILVPVVVGEDEGLGEAGARRALAAVWARQKIAHLGRRAIGDGERDDWFDGQITRTALDHGLMSAFTSFVAVDSLTRTAGPIGRTVEVPVPTPEGVNFNTTVQERPTIVRRAPGDDGP
ncbi:MAG: VIT domain-containing protein [Phycisphaerales bacterium]